ncbi:MAG TPA: arginine deiminase family protein [Candidatus Acidoferrales bacterium]|nr:arginine deiminase family protein [Candidatus Acidoferrales bacterium]
MASGKSAKLDRLFDVALVRPPPNSYSNCISTNPARSEIDVVLAKEQHRTYVSLLKESGVTVVTLPAVEDYPDSVFLQDPAVLGTVRSVLGRFGAQSRRGEEEALRLDLKKYEETVGKLNQVKAPGTLEGGDILVTNTGLFVGKSQRTNPDGIGQLAGFLPGMKVKPVMTKLFHLLCGVTYLSDGIMIISPQLIEKSNFPGFRFIEIPEKDAYSCDALYLGERRVLIPSGFPYTVTQLKKAGYVTVEVDVSEFYKGDGGVTCLSSPIYTIL